MTAPKSITEQLLDAADSMRTVVSMWSGVRAQLIEAGWSPLNAELATLKLMDEVAKNSDPSAEDQPE